MRCPRCKSEKVSIYKNGRKVCKSCKYQWVKGIKNTYKGYIYCPDCSSKNVKIRESRYLQEDGRKKKRRRFECNSCGATWWENSLQKIRPDERKEWIKWIQEEYRRNGNIEKIKQYIHETTGLKETAVRILINKALGNRRKLITKKDIEKALYWRKQGLKWKDIERLVGYKWKSIYNKARYVYGLKS